MLKRTFEFFAIFIAMPLALLFFLPPLSLYAVFIVTLLVSLWLLHKTPDFQWSELIYLRDLKHHWKTVLAFFVVSLVGLSLLAWQFVPEHFMDSWKGRESLLLRILIVYPFLSALPQEIIYRVLFFKRYKPLFRSTNMAIIANASCFSLFHLFYQNWFAVGLTFVGGLAFAWAYEHKKSFSLAWVLHAVAGQIIFAVGLGTYFYHGAIGQATP